MDNDQRRNAPDTTRQGAAPLEPTEAAEVPVAPDDLETALLQRAVPRSPDTPASLLRKEQVRARLFHKLEPIRIGRFILLEPLGAGAMGEIYTAYDDQLDRKVALKLVKGSAHSHRKGDERLLREAQTLARISHPNVVQVYEAGTYNGRLFIAMELIRGKTLTSWLKDAEQVPRAVRQREILRQFIAAGRGLEAAHAAGLAHRDFKPDNVLVGDDGRVRVVDFGLARALADEPEAGAPVPLPEEIATSETLTMNGATVDLPAAPAPDVPGLKAALRLTETGTIVGTPRFMAPEQLRGAVADPRSDQFSFCVALYHALCGVYPFAGDSWQQLRSSIESGEVQPPPNVQIPAFVRGAMRRGLSVEPSQRFPGMRELLAALEPKTRRRRVGIAAAVGLVAIGLGAGVFARSRVQADPCADAGAAIDAPWSADRQAGLEAAFRRSDLPFAESAWRGVKARIDDYAGHWRAEATAACRATNVARTQSPQQLDRRMLCLDRGSRQLASLVAELGTGAPGAVEHAIEATEALPAVDACGDATNLLFGLEPPPAPVAAKVASVRNQIARAFTLELLGRSEESLALAREASAVAGGLGYPPVHAEALAQTAGAAYLKGTAEARGEAEQLYLEALDLAEAARHDVLAVQIWHDLVRQAAEWHNRDQALAWWRRDQAAVRRLGDNVDEEAKLHYLRGRIYYIESKFTQAADEQRRAIAAIEHAPAHRFELCRYYDALAATLSNLDQLDEAIRLHERALAVAAETFGPGHPNVARFQADYGWTLRRHGQLDRAASALEGALASLSARDRESHPAAAKLHSQLSVVYSEGGHLDRAAEHGRASLAIHLRARSSGVDVAETHRILGVVAFKRGDFADALAQYEEALALYRQQLQDGHAEIGVTEGDIAETLLVLERYDEAMPHLTTAEHIFERFASRRNQAWILSVRGEVLARQRQLAAAILVLEQALALFDEHEADPTNQVQAMWTLARALHDLGRDESRVRSLAERALALLATQGEAGAHHRDEIAHFIERLPARSAPPAIVR